MNCHLLVPDLFWPAAAGIEPYRDLELPALEALLARGRRARIAGASPERWLAAAYQLPDDLPLAPHALRGDGVDPGNDCWMRADPVHLRVHRDRLVLVDATRLALTPADTQEFIAALNAHFAPEGIRFSAPTPQRWYLKLATEPRLRTTPTAEAAGRSIEPLLPSGADCALWRRVFNEAQMLLHGHPRNQEREAQGQLPVNSVWLWGAGRTHEMAAAYDAVWSDHPLATGLAAASGAAAHRLPASGAMLLKELHGRTQLVVLASLPATAYGDATAWREAVLALEQSWLAPLLAGLKDATVAFLAFHGLGPDFGYAAELRHSDRFRFWRRTRPLHTYAA